MKTMKLAALMAAMMMTPTKSFSPSSIASMPPAASTKALVQVRL